MDDNALSKYPPPSVSPSLALGSGPLRLERGASLFFGAALLFFRNACLMRFKPTKSIIDQKKKKIVESPNAGWVERERAIDAIGDAIGDPGRDDRTRSSGMMGR